jgi:hypothetical protein
MNPSETGRKADSDEAARAKLFHVEQFGLANGSSAPNRESQIGTGINLEEASRPLRCWTRGMFARSQHGNLFQIVPRGTILAGKAIEGVKRIGRAQNAPASFGSG